MTEQAQTEQAQAAAKRGQRRMFQGIVLSNKMSKTITVETTSLKLHAKYKKFIKRYTKFKAHDENETANEGDLVEIRETRPLSKTKRYRLLRVVRRAQV